MRDRTHKERIRRQTGNIRKIAQQHKEGEKREKHKKKRNEKTHTKMREAIYEYKIHAKKRNKKRQSKNNGVENK